MGGRQEEGRAREKRKKDKKRTVCSGCECESKEAPGCKREIMKEREKGKVRERKSGGEEQED